MNLTAAIYARKSTEQRADADAKSVALQVSAAKAFAKAKGWAVGGVYVDDAISGAEPARLVNRQRLLASLATPQRPHVVLMRDSSRFSRSDGDEAFGELKRIAQAGVEVWFYQEDRPFRHGTFGDNVVGFVRAEMNAEYRRQISRDVTNAMVKKAEAGFLTTKPCFGYDAARVDGHIERRINAAHAIVVHRIFELRAKGFGVARIARMLNQEDAATPRPWRPGAITGWSGQTVNDALHRELYRGVIEWNKTRTVIVNGRKSQVVRPRAEWMRVPAPDLRIVSEKEWKAAHHSMAAARAACHLRSPGAAFGPRRDAPSQYLLVGYATCGLCGGGIHVRVRQRANGQREKVPTGYYACTTHYQRGRRWRDGEDRGPKRDGGPSEREGLCPHVELWSMDALNQAVIASVLGAALSPALETRVLAAARKRFQQRSTGATTSAPLRRELADLDRQRARLTDAIARTVATLEILVERLKAVEARRQEILTLLGETDDAAAAQSWQDIEAQIRTRLVDYRAILAGSQAPTARPLLSQLLATPITLTPFTDAKGFRAVRFEMKIGMHAIFGEVTNGPFPTQSTPDYLSVTGVLRSNRRAA
jgi:DNA invertase Pin-like site-specific DNA recombinase